MITKKIFPAFIFIFVSVLFFSCEKESLADLNFQVKKIDDVYHCSWTATNISTFERYTIVRSPLNPASGDIKYKTWINEQERDDIAFTIPNESGFTLYFQLIVDIGDRYLRSEIIAFETPTSDVLEIIAVNLNFALHYPEKNAFYVLEKWVKRLTYYDYEEKQIKANEGINFYFARTDAQFGNNGFGDEIYVIDSYDLIVLDANTLEEKEKYTPYKPIYSVATNNNGMIALALGNSSNQVQILSRENMTVLNTLTSVNPNNVRRSIAFLSKENNEIVEVGAYFSNYFRLDENGIVQDSNFNSNPFAYSTAIPDEITVSPSGNYYLYNARGQVFDSELNGITDLGALSGGLYENYFFNKEETNMYAITANGNFIDKFSIPDFEWEGRKEFTDAAAVSLFYRDEKIHVLMREFFFNCLYTKVLNF